MSEITYFRGKLEVHVISARDLRDRELLVKMDPYVLVKCGDEKFKSKVHKNGGTSPTWNQFMEFNLKEDEAKTPLRFEVWDYKHLAEDRQVGRADIPLDMLIKHAGGKEEGHWFQLTYFDDPEKKAGEINIGLRYEGDGVPREKDIKRKEELEKERLAELQLKAEEEKLKAEEEKKRVEEEQQKEAALAQQKQAIEEENQKLQQQLAEAKLNEQKLTEETKQGHGTHTLHKHNRLKLGERLVSTNGTYTATLQQEDGNFVLAQSGSMIWNASTNDTGAVELIIQKDNNVVIYDKHQKQQWSTDTAGAGTGHVRLILQNDGNLVLKDDVDTTLWATNTGSS